MRQVLLWRGFPEIVETVIAPVEVAMVSLRPWDAANVEGELDLVERCADAPMIDPYGRGPALRSNDNLASGAADKLGV